jgi:hypothetical protein
MNSEEPVQLDYCWCLEDRCLQQQAIEDRFESGVTQMSPAVALLQRAVKDLAVHVQIERDERV